MPSRVKRTLPFGLLVIPLLVARPSLDNLLGMIRLPIGGTSVTMGFAFNIFITLVGLTLVAHGLLVNKDEQRNVLLAGAAWIPFLLASAASAVYSPVPVEALSTLFNLVTYFSVAFIGLMYGQNLSRSNLTTIIALSGVVPAVFGLVQVLLSLSGPRLTSTFGHPNILAFFCLIYISFLFHAQLNGFVRNSVGRMAIWILVIAASVALLYTGTRSAFLSTFLFLVCYSAVRKPIFVLPLLLLPPLALLIPAVAARITDAISGSTPVTYDYFVSAMRGDIWDAGPLSLDSGTWRRYLWKATWPWIEQKPLFGYGLNSFTVYSREFFPLSGSTGSGAHNVYIQLIFEGGYISLISYLWIFVVVLIVPLQVRCSRSDRTFVYALVASYSLCAFTDNMLSYLSVNVFLWFVIFLVLGGVPRVRQAQPIKLLTYRHGSARAI